LLGDQARRCIETGLSIDCAGLWSAGVTPKHPCPNFNALLVHPFSSELAILVVVTPYAILFAVLIGSLRTNKATLIVLTELTVAYPSGPVLAKVSRIPIPHLS